jgi:hypothetical protein
MKPHDYVAKALRRYSQTLCANPDSVEPEEAKDLDRALRSCPGITDIDVVWVMWRYIGESRGWLTANEMRWTKSGYRYPKGV